MIEPEHIESGLKVVSSDGEMIGRVKGLLSGGRYFQVDCHFALDYYVPIEAIVEVADQRVVLSVTAAQAVNRGWEAKPSGGNESP